MKKNIFLITCVVAFILFSIINIFKSLVDDFFAAQPLQSNIQSYDKSHRFEDVSDVKYIEPQRFSQNSSKTSHKESKRFKCHAEMLQGDGENSGNKYTLDYKFNKAGKFSEYFSSSGFDTTLKKRLNNVFALYSYWLPELDAKSVALNILFVASTKKFEQTLLNFGVDPIQVQGIYLPHKNLSLVKVNSEQQAINTAVHEVVHAINFAYFGQLPRLINEGIAEFFESGMVSHATSEQIYQLPNWVNLSSPYDELLDFYTLIYSEVDWHTSNNRSLYFSVNLWFHFLLTSEQGSKVLSMILQQKYKSPCEHITAEYLVELLSEHYPLFEQDFNYWYEQQIENSLLLKAKAKE